MLTKEMIALYEKHLDEVPASGVHFLINDWHEHEKQLAQAVSAYEMAENERRKLESKMTALIMHLQAILSVVMRSAAEK